MQTLSQIYQVIQDAVKLLPTTYNIVQLPIQNILDETFNAKYPLANIEYIGSNNNANEVIRTYRVHMLKVQKQSDIDLNNIIGECEIDALTAIKQLDYTSQLNLYNIDASGITPVRQFTADYTAGVYFDVNITEINSIDIC
jgi:hypothetical protein